MAKKTNKAPVKTARMEDKPTTLKDLIRPEVLGKLQAQAAEMKASEQSHAEEVRRQAEEARKAEQKKLDNNFEHLLEQSALDWHKFK